jgi:hypothetical protein
MPPRPVRRILVGRMWAKETADGWKLLEALSPAWVHNEPEG